MASKKPATQATPERARKASLIVPGYSLKNVQTGDKLFIRATSELFAKPDFDQKTGKRKLDKQGEEAFIHLLRVEDLDTGEFGEMVVPIILYNAWSESGTLTGRSFELVKGEAEANKATKWQLYEVD